MNRAIATFAWLSIAGCAGAAPERSPASDPQTRAVSEPAPVEPAPAEPAPAEPAPAEPGPAEPAQAEPDRVTCAADGDCHFDDGCVPRRCVAGPGPEQVACEETAPPPGNCLCYQQRCTLRPSATRAEVTDADACDPVRAPCGLELASGRCVPNGTNDLSPVDRWSGPQCACDNQDHRCHVRWEEPIACRSVEDCWVEVSPRRRPIARPARLRGRRFRPCRDGEHAPACADGYCTLVAFSC
ncbi:MAG: hypothetical protein IT378_13455 [Sandaracinaceae bacterium]|nr:hypothetical protein [Sandaracinaceae bacterium]